ncbi:MAG: hypothetical protein Q8P18_00500 [Pseudomonadota bacterium]|nr:hypothetical protein [Pseudomonadota bacterium]
METEPSSTPNVPPATPLERWLRHGSEGDHGAETWPWYKVLWLTGVDYFSTLGYQPGIALLAAGALAPLATSILVLVTLFGAVPMYREVAKRSYLGQGSISMLERLLPGWRGKLFILGLIGFAVTAFVVTMTLSAADAALHVTENPLLEHWLGHAQIPITIGLLVMLGVVFLRGFREAIGAAVWIAVPYLLLNVVVIVRGIYEVALHPELLASWQTALSLKGDPAALALLALLTFPKLALGLSGFETGVTVMPLVRGSPTDSTTGPPVGRIRATEKLLLVAAVIMSGVLIGSSLVTTLLIPEAAWSEGGEAAGRALAWVAHHYLGSAFGTAYDISTILILWFAGASAMAALLNIIPKYLPRFGMAPQWVGFVRPLILVITAINIVVTIYFKAEVEAQAGAYATGVLALFVSAAIAVTLAIRAEAKAERKAPWRALPFALITLVFSFAFADNVYERPDGIVIASVFILSILVLGALSRYWRATEFRVERLVFANPESEKLWEQMRPRKVHFVTVKHADTAYSRVKARIKKHYSVQGPMAFLHVELATDRSDFDSALSLRVQRLGDDYRITVHNAVAVANTVAFISEQLDPISIFLGLTRENPMTQAFRYLIWGEGETGILVYQILLRYWNRTHEDDVRPNIFLMSD